MARKVLFLNCSVTNGGCNFSLPHSSGSAQIPGSQSALGWLLRLGCQERLQMAVQVLFQSLCAMSSTQGP